MSRRTAWDSSVLDLNEFHILVAGGWNRYPGRAVIHISLALARSFAVVIRRTIWFISWKWEVFGLGVGCDTDYPDWKLSWVYSARLGKYWVSGLTPLKPSGYYM